MRPMAGKYFWTLHEMEHAGKFLLEFLKRPGKVGSICPSSTMLAAKLASAASIGGEGLIIDLGAGSGTVSAELLREGVAPDRIVAIEALPGFAKEFSHNCPGVPLIIADARELKTLLDRRFPGKSVAAILSSLPFRTMSPAVTGAILRDVKAVMAERGGVLVQYSYAWWLRYPLRNYGLRPRSASMVYWNIPPARVEAYGKADIGAPPFRFTRKR